MNKNRVKITYQEKGVIKSINISQEEFEKKRFPKNIIAVKREKTFLKKSTYISEKDIKDRLYELSLMLNSNILLDRALDILIKNEKKRALKEFLQDLKKSFCSSQDMGKSLDKYKINPLIKSLFKLVQSSGNSASNIEVLSQIVRENYEIKRDFFKTMFYPTLLCVTFLFALIAIFKFVVPSFESILINSQTQLSFATKTLFVVKDFFENYIFIFLFFFTFVFTVFYKIYKKSLTTRVFFDGVIAKNLLLISKLYRLKSLYIYFVVLDILLKNRYEFLDSIKEAKILLDNNYLLDRITQIEYLLKSGKSVRFAFESSNLFDDMTLSLIDTGEITNCLPKVIYELKNIYKKRFDDNLKVFSLLIEPLFFVTIMVLILWIVFAVFVPLWGMNDMLKV